mmetsp:Transcript_48456/g.156500  ORF Transcript_48456/g.156500 Transcript_48456/m.156500 type:complete len:350 (-) Transcript_48456:504-1553(-)
MDKQGVSARYIIGAKIGAGSFGDVYMGKDRNSGEDVAIKVESADVKHKCLHREFRACRHLEKAGTSRVPRVHEFESTATGAVMVSELLGPSLEDLFDFCKHRFNLKTVLCIADQMLECLQHVHAVGFLHRDLKPANFLIGLGNRANTVHLADFGLVGAWLDPTSGQHVDCKKSRGPVGTLRYMSINTHAGVEQSRRDDLESLGYVLLYFLRGSLPWQDDGQQDVAKRRKDHVVMNKKLCVPIQDLCKGLPEEFATYMSYVRSLPFQAAPNYDYLRDLFKGLFARKGFRDDHYYDWTYQMEMLTNAQGNNDACPDAKEQQQQQHSSATTKDTENGARFTEQRSSDSKDTN